MTRKHSVWIVLSLFALVTACGDGVVDPDLGFGSEVFTTYDLDSDSFLTDIEFRAGFTSANVFELLDTDEDGFIQPEEFDDDLGAFGSFDLNSDDRLNENEFLTGTFQAFDTNGDFLISEAEFSIGIALF